jgi:hypothetical protein
MPTRREWLAAAMAALIANRAAATPVRRATMRIRKNPGCGCCDKWAEHLEKLGFDVTVEEDERLDAYRDRAGVPRQLRSCHTGEVGGYLVEGHVPGDLVRRMLDEKAEIAGLAVPGMPMGSPGMEGAVKHDYDVIAFRKNGSTFVYASR